MDREFRVDVICRQSAVYRVRAEDAEAAKRRATERWQNGEPSDVGGLDGCELMAVGVSEVPSPLREAQDDELILRFIRERERLLAQLGDGVEAHPNDAISASQAARDLGWLRSDSLEGGPDTVRAAFALERLCGRQKLVCFERSRARRDERGNVRLYCSPEYLHRLTADLEEPADIAS